MISRFLSPIIMIAALTSGALAADLPSRAPAPEPYIAAAASHFTWSGCYVGVAGGGNWGRSQHYFDDPNFSTTFYRQPQTGGIDLSGGLVGGTIGCNHQFGNNFVVGVEGDYSWTNKSGRSGLIAPFNTTEFAETRETSLGTERGRLGFAADRVLLYGTGGLAFANEKFKLVDPVDGSGSLSKTVTGWTAGVGVEWAFSDNWSLKAEYLHFDFGKNAFAAVTTSSGRGFFAQRRVSLTDEVVRIGLNYRFDFGAKPVAVVAKY